MKGIHVVAIAFLATCTVIAANENLDQDQSVLDNTRYDRIPIKCPFPERHWWNTTTNLAHESDCTKYYKCAVGRPVLQDCPLMYKHDPHTRLHYNRFEQVCDWPWRAGCSSCPEPDENNEYPPSSSRISNKNDNCNSYWECPIRGKPRLAHCEQGCFSRTCQKCVRNPKGGYCDDKRRPRPPPPPPPPPPRCKDYERKLHDCDCNKFYECMDNEWNDANCEGGLHFDPRTQECVPANEAPPCRHPQLTEN